MVEEETQGRREDKQRLTLELAGQGYTLVDSGGTGMARYTAWIRGDRVQKKR